MSSSKSIKKKKLSNKIFNIKFKTSVLKDVTKNFLKFFYCQNFY